MENFSSGSSWKVSLAWVEMCVPVEWFFWPISALGFVICEAPGLPSHAPELFGWSGNVGFHVAAE